MTHAEHRGSQGDLLGPDLVEGRGRGAGGAEIVRFGRQGKINVNRQKKVIDFQRE
jgi:hypothetical protein